MSTVALLRGMNPGGTGAELADWGEERWAVRGRELSLWLPGGIGRSPLGAAMAKPPPGPAVTLRNLNPVERLVAPATRALRRSSAPSRRRRTTPRR